MQIGVPSGSAPAAEKRTLAGASAMAVRLSHVMHASARCTSCVVNNLTASEFMRVVVAHTVSAMWCVLLRTQRVSSASFRAGITRCSRRDLAGVSKMPATCDALTVG